MKKSFLFILLIFAASILFSCSDSSGNNDNGFKGEIIEVKTIKEQEDEIDYIKINLESGSFKGAYTLIVNIHEEELEIDINRLKVGQKVEVITNGIIAESKPPKVLAKEIKIIENE
ncbi:DUF3221 domain-containing protein [Pontibacillus marinus]|uniref:DUF3221 domain-containing protein n=1 Tax=Pontibacillus marinus BH030004 = DSM 16465 TaxID=1385511 RepID=A0A0A5HU27_9BACI|nr:DUF3221 domain-containing protein [Pontibacillus marinus]KGX87147.1 hypothetical protein N783_10495 [Pontibacillus marinus BH030004 = DSM 16465]